MTAIESKRQRALRHASLGLAVLALAILLGVAARGLGLTGWLAAPAAPTLVARDGQPGLPPLATAETADAGPAETASPPSTTPGQPGAITTETVRAAAPPTVASTSRPSAIPSPRPAQPTDAPPSATVSVPTLTPTSEPPTSTLPPTTTPSPTFTATPTRHPTGEPTRPPRVALGQVTAGQVGTTLTVAEAGIADVIYLSKGIKYTLTDATGNLALVVWQNVLEEVPGRLELLPGSRVRVTGEIEIYEGQLEIVPATGTDVVVLDRGSRLPVEEWPVSRVSASDQGRVLIVAGRVVQVTGDRWLNVRLNDGTGEITIYLPERLTPYLSTGIEPGVNLRVAGQVDVYHGELEIIPLAAVDVQVGP